MKKLIIILVLVAFIGCNRNPYEDLNNHPKSTVMSVQTDTINSDSIVYHFYLKSIYGNYTSIRVDPKWAILFKEGDIL